MGSRPPLSRFFAILGTGAVAKSPDSVAAAVGTDEMIDAGGRDADAIRYAVLRKLASGMRHALMGELQTLQFSAELAARVVDTGTSGPKVAECIKQLPEQTRTAVDSSRAMIEWLRPDDKASATVDETLRHCLRVAGDDWPLRGIEASTDVRSGDARVSKPVLRELLVTSLLALADVHGGPIDVAISAESIGDQVVVSLSARRVERKTPFPPLSVYRALSYDDVMTIGRANHVPCSCADGTITFRLTAMSVSA